MEKYGFVKRICTYLTNGFKDHKTDVGLMIEEMDNNPSKQTARLIDVIRL